VKNKSTFCSSDYVRVVGMYALMADEGLIPRFAVNVMANL
jgi:hypothetical protein